MDDLEELDRCRPPEGGTRSVEGGVSTPLVWEEWDRALRNHPDQRFKDYIIGGISHGFRLGFNYKTQCNSPVILWEKRGLPETNCNKRYFYRILFKNFL